MKVYDINDQQGRVFAFEISSSVLNLGTTGVWIVIGTIPNVKIISVFHFFEFFRETNKGFCEFELDGRRFRACGVSSGSYWIGDEPPEWCEQLEIVRQTFLGYSQWEHLKQNVIRLLK